MQRIALNLKNHPLDGHSLIEASAGTGKTFTISHLYIRYLLEKKFDVRQILTVTFTNAATQELIGRIRRRIVEVYEFLTGLSRPEPEMEELYAQYRDLQDAPLLLQKALASFDEAAVFSIHGFCQRLLGMFPLDMQAQLGQHIIDNEKQLRLAAMRDFWRREVTGGSVATSAWIHAQWKTPDDLLAAVEPLLEAAQRGDSPFPVSATAFAEVQRTWSALCDLWTASADQIRDFLMHSPALSRGKVRPVTVEKLMAQLENFFTGDIPYQLPDKWLLLTHTKLSASFNKDKHDERVNLRFFQATESFRQQHEAWLIENRTSLLVQAARHVEENVQREKTANQQLSFNDLIRLVSRALKDDGKVLAARVNRLYPVAMVDEFQDTDNQQYHIFSSLYAEQGDLVVIGDPKQAIYSFRGADVFTYRKASKALERHFTLDTNYRSSADYVALVNQVFSSNPSAFIFDDFIRYAPSRAVKDNHLRRGEKTLPPLVSWLHPANGESVNREAARTFFAQICAQEILGILRADDLSVNDVAVKASDLAILVRTGRQAQLVQEKLAELGIGSALSSQDSVFASQQALDICQLLSVLVEPADSRRLFGLLMTDLFAYSMQQVERLQQHNQQLVRLLEQMQDYRRHWREKGVVSMFFQLLRDQGTLHKNIHYLDGERKLTNWLHLVEILQQQAGGHSSQVQALNWLITQCEKAAQDTVSEEHQLRLESDSDLVRIVTIHKSKGLQYPIVFLPFAWDVSSVGAKSLCYSYHDSNGERKTAVADESQRERWKLENLAEEIRLLYVAMTRAQHRCYLGWGNVRGAGHSALAHCLYRDHVEADAAADFADDAMLRGPFEKLNAGRQRVDIVQAALSDVDAAGIEKPAQKIVPALRFNRRVVQQWRIGSYSHIVSSGQLTELHRPDYDALSTHLPVADDIEPEQGLDRFTFYKGAKAGNFLHDLLELQAFDGPIDKDMIVRKSNEYAFGEEWLPCLVEWLQDIIHSPLDGFTLAEIGGDSRVSEMEFYLHCENLQASKLNAWLLEAGYSHHHQQLSFTDIRGYLKGYIDLVFEYQGKYYIADYKSNYLGPGYESYTREACEDAMFEHHYHLQYLLYSVALHRYLQQQLQDYSYARHFGGVYYLFLRGMSPQQARQQGIFFHLPTLSTIDRLDGLLRE